MKKYNGFRNYYRKSKGKCEAVVRCKTELGDDKLPTSVSVEHVHSMHYQQDSFPLHTK